MNEWNIQGRAHACQACSGSFMDKQPYHTLLFDEKQLFHRVDVCERCWSEQYSQGAQERKGFVSHWQGIYEAPPPAPPEPIKRENAESLLRKLIELNDPAHLTATFILAVMLERKRLLKVREQVLSENGRVFVYEQPKTGDVFTIPDPNLHLNQLEAVQRDVADLLEKGIPLPGETPSESPPAQTESVPAPSEAVAEPVPSAV